MSSSSSYISINRSSVLVLHNVLFLLNVGVSTRTRKPTHPPKLPRPTQKLADPTLMTVGDGSPPPKSDFGGLDGGFSSSKLDPTDETYERRPNLPRFVQIHWYFGEKFGSFWLDTVKILVFLLRSGGEMKILLRSMLDMVLLLRILLRSGDDLKFLLKSGLDVVVFASIFAWILWFLLKFGLVRWF